MLFTDPKTMASAHANVFSQIIHNPVLVAAVWGWFCAQSLKVVLGVVRERRFDFKWFVGSGGMPSSHAAFVTAAALAVGMTAGFNSPLFAATLVFAVIIMFDAQGVRHQSGRQAEALNWILDDIAKHRGIREEPLKELFGHTPIEVLAGGLIGLCAAWLAV